MKRPNPGARLALAAPGPAALLLVLPLLSGSASLSAQNANPEAARRVEAAGTAAGDDHPRIFHYLCGVPGSPRGSAAPPAPAGMPDWYAAPAKVFDNLYFVGTRSLNAWAVDTSEGIVVIDPLYDENAEVAIVDGLRRVGLDPDRISHVIVSHGHGDHYGGARRLQERFGARVLMAPADWDLVAGSGGNEPRPERDIEVTDGQVFTVGGVPFTFTHTPGHTPGTISTTFPVRAGNDTHIVAIWGGTAMREDPDFYREYMASAVKFAGVARSQAADVMLSNHDIFDEAHLKMQEMREAGGNGAHPFVIGTESVSRYMEVVLNCAAAAAARIPPNAD